VTSSSSKKSIWARGPFLFGIFLTIAIIVFGVISLHHWPPCNEIGPCISNWQKLKYHSEPNQIGDLLAGFASALAFAWIVVTVLLQAIELREQREQFEKMATAQEKQVELLVTQGKIFEKEQLERQQEGTRKLVEEYISGFCDIVRMYANGQSTWNVVEKNGNSRRHNFFSGYDIVADNELLKKLAYFPPPVAAGVVKLQNAGVKIESGPSYEDFEHLFTRVHKAIIHMDQLSLDQQQRFKNYGLLEIHEWLSEILEHDFWRQLPDGGRVNVLPA